MTSARDIIDAMFDFELETETLGSVRCKVITVAVMLDDAWEQARREEIDGPTFVRKLLGLIAQRMAGEHKKNDKSKLEAPLSESDIRRLTDKEIETFAREIFAHNTWLLESYEAAERSVGTNEKGERGVSVKRRKVTFPRNEGERDSDYLVRAVRRHMTEQARHRQRIFQSIDSIGPQLGATIKSLSVNLGRPYTKLLGESIGAIKTNRNMIDRIMTPAGMSIEFSRVHSTWLDNLGSGQDQIFKLLQRDATHFLDSQKSLWESVTKRLATSESLLGATVAFNAVQPSIALPALSTRHLLEPINAMMADYGRLAESIRTSLEVTRLPKFVLPETAREVLASSYAANVLGVSDAENAEQGLLEIRSAAEVEIEGGNSRCLILLEAVDPGLVRLYKGAYDALQGTNADRERHCLSSLRELYNHLMRKIAPDQMVLEWIGGDETLLHEGRPTRKARICYVLRDLNNGPLADFTDNDTKAFVNFLAVFNRLHDLELTLSRRELRALWLRANSWLSYILEFVQSD